MLSRDTRTECSQTLRISTGSRAHQIRASSSSKSKLTACGRQLQGLIGGFRPGRLVRESFILYRVDQLSCYPCPAESEKHILGRFRCDVLDVVLNEARRKDNAALPPVSAHSVAAVEAAPPWERGDEFPALGFL